MKRFSALVMAVLALVFAAALPAAAQMPDPAGTPEHRAAISRLDRFDGEWVGRGSIQLPGLGPMEFTQTERVGSLTGGAIKLVEGRAYDASGKTLFNAFAVISFDPKTGKYVMSSYVGGERGHYPLQATADGFIWEMPAAAGAKIRYTAVVENGRWREIGEYIVEGQPPRRFIELDLRRKGDSAWPAGNPVTPR